MDNNVATGKIMKNSFRVDKNFVYLIVFPERMNFLVML